MIIGPQIAAIRFNGYIKNVPRYIITIPDALIKELQARGETIEHLDNVRLTIEKVGTKAKAKPWAFKRKNDTT